MKLKSAGCGFEVIATTIISVVLRLYKLFEMTITGRRFTDDKSVEGIGRNEENITLLKHCSNPHRHKDYPKNRDYFVLQIINPQKPR